VGLLGLIALVVLGGALLSKLRRRLSGAPDEPAPPPPEPGPADEWAEQLERLVDRHMSGELTYEEFLTERAKLVASRPRSEGED
jgi:hypothetical protein